MDFGVHLPLIGFDERLVTLNWLAAYVQTAEQLGFQAVAANDHLVFSRPWLDGPTALAATLAWTGSMTLMTTVALPVVRGTVALAETLAAVDLLSGGRLVAGVGPGWGGGRRRGVGGRWGWVARSPGSGGVRQLPRCGDAGARTWGLSRGVSATRMESGGSRIRFSRPGRRSGSEAGDRKPVCGELRGG